MTDIAIGCPDKMFNNIPDFFEINGTFAKPLPDCLESYSKQVGGLNPDKSVKNKCKCATNP